MDEQDGQDVGVLFVGVLVGVWCVFGRAGM